MSDCKITLGKSAQVESIVIPGLNGWRKLVRPKGVRNPRQDQVAITYRP